jgi:protein ImuB
MDTLFTLPQPTQDRPARPSRAPRRAGRAGERPTPASRPRAGGVRSVALLLEPLPIWLAQRRDPTLARTPVAVVQEGRVAHANAPARRLGVSRGMRLEGAKLRAESLIVLTPSPVDLAHAWSGVLRDLSAWTPWLAPRRQGLALLRATPREALELAEAFEARVGVGPDHQSAELAAAAARPGAVRAVAPGEERAFLEKLPLRFLRSVGLSDADLTRLHWLGLATAGDLAAWSREQLEGYLGEAGRALLPYLHGPRETGLPAYAPPPPLRRRLAFDQPLFEPFELEGAIDHLARALEGALGGEAARRLTLVADVHGLAIPASRLAKHPMRAAHQIRRQALLALSDSGAAPAGVDGLSIELDERARVGEQEGLWASRRQRIRAQEAVLERFPDALREVRWGDPHAPAVDHAWNWVPKEEPDTDVEALSGRSRVATARAARATAEAAAEERAAARDDAVPLFATHEGEHPVAIVLGSGGRRIAARASAEERPAHPDAARAGTERPERPARPAAARPDAAVDVAALEIERAERWPGDRGRLTNRTLRAA